MKNAVKCDLARYRSYPYSRERAPQNLGVISFIFHSSPYCRASCRASCTASGPARHRAPPGTGSGAPAPRCRRASGRRAAPLPEAQLHRKAGHRTAAETELVVSDVFLARLGCKEPAKSGTRDRMAACKSGQGVHERRLAKCNTATLAKHHALLPR